MLDASATNGLSRAATLATELRTPGCSRSGGLARDGSDGLPRLADQTLELPLRNAGEIDDDVGFLAPHEPHKGLRIGFEEEFLPLLGKVKIKAVGSNHREDAFLGAKTRAAEMIDLGHAIQREGDLPDVCCLVHRDSLPKTSSVAKKKVAIRHEPRVIECVGIWHAFVEQCLPRLDVQWAS